MPDLTSNLPDTHFRVPQRTLRSLLESYRQDQSTGLMRLRYPSGMDLVSTFLDGTQTGLYGCLNQRMEAIPRQSWTYAMDRPDASIAFLNLSVEAMRLARIAHEAPVLGVEQSQCTTRDLSGRVQDWAAGTSPIVLLTRSERVERVYLIAGNSTPIIEELAIEDGESRFSFTDSAFPTTLANEEYQVMWFDSDGDHELWLEYRLRYTFNPLVRMVINRFSQLAGRTLTERLCEQLSAWLRDQGWQMIITINGLSNRHYFETIQQAGSAYLALMRRFNDASSQAIGLRMAEELWWETLLKMDPQRRDLLKKYFYYQNGLDHSGMAQRIES
jgi:hypothetical protein